MSAEGFVALWPTIVLNRRIPGSENANQALSSLIEASDRGREDMTVDYRRENFLTLQHPACTWLRECINITVQAYFDHIGIGYDLRWTLHGWPNLNRFGDYHDYHNHPRAYLSGTYYVRVPSELEQLHTRGDVRSGCLTLYDPRGSVNMSAIKGDPYVEPEYTVQPAPDMILLWPAFLNHFVHPNLSRQPRMSVSYNVMLEWSDAYLPSQEHPA